MLLLRQTFVKKSDRPGQRNLLNRLPMLLKPAIGVYFIEIGWLDWRRLYRTFRFGEGKDGRFVRKGRDGYDAFGFNHESDTDI